MTRLEAAIVAAIEVDAAWCRRCVATGITWPPDPTVKGEPWRNILHPATRELVDAAEEAGIWRDTLPRIFD